MLWLFGALVIISSIVLGVIVLIQNPKGGGLTASLGGFSNQIMGVKRTTDILEKGTWLFAGIIALLAITSTVFIPEADGSRSHDHLFQQTQPNNPVTIPQGQTAPLVPSQQQAPGSQQVPTPPQP